MKNASLSDAWETKALNWQVSYTVLSYQNASHDTHTLRVTPSTPAAFNTHNQMQSITKDTIIQLFNATYTAQHVAFCKFPAETLAPFSIMT